MSGDIRVFASELGTFGAEYAGCFYFRAHCPATAGSFDRAVYLFRSVIYFDVMFFGCVYRCSAEKCRGGWGVGRSDGVDGGGDAHCTVFDHMGNAAAHSNDGQGMDVFLRGCQGVLGRGAGWRVSFGTSLRFFFGDGVGVFFVVAGPPEDDGRFGRESGVFGRGSVGEVSIFVIEKSHMFRGAPSGLAGPILPFIFSKES